MDGIVLSSIIITVVGAVLAVFMLMFITLVNPTSPAERERLLNKINETNAKISELESEKWLSIVQDSLGDKFFRIESQQYLSDQKRYLLHRSSSTRVKRLEKSA